MKDERQTYRSNSSTSKIITLHLHAKMNFVLNVIYVSQKYIFG